MALIVNLCELPLRCYLKIGLWPLAFGPWLNQHQKPDLRGMLLRCYNPHKQRLRASSCWLLAKVKPNFKTPQPLRTQRSTEESLCEPLLPCYNPHKQRGNRAVGPWLLAF